MRFKWLLTLSILLVSAATAAAEQSAAANQKKDAAPQMTLGNGEANWIITEGATREGATFVFAEVHVDDNSWLVMHGFKDGDPVGDDYVGATYVTKGKNRDVHITVDAVPTDGELYIVMLHRDVNENKKFDFVFVDEINVLDKAVFEGSKMIAHRFAAP